MISQTIVNIGTTTRRTATHCDKRSNTDSNTPCTLKVLETYDEYSYSKLTFKRECIILDQVNI